jgi:hypothetical protein
MPQQRLVLAGAILAALLAAGTGRADPIRWGYGWSANPVVVRPDSPPHAAGGITLDTSCITVVGQSPGSAAGSANIAAANLTTFLFAPPPDGRPDRFTNRPYALTMTLTDAASRASGALPFAGVFNGTLGATSAHLTTTFTSPASRRLTLGGNVYTVTLGPYKAPGPPLGGDGGMIGAHVDVRPGGTGTTDPTHAPEPSGLTLAGLALLGAASWRCRQVA